ncbi:MAG: alpha/beta hydrolase, partial [Pseudomonadota bacterium]
LGRDMYDTLAAMCSVWPAGVRDQNMHTPLQSNIPTLLLSGEFDPITPPAWAQQAANGLTNAIHIVAPGQGHGVIARGCLPRLIMDFIDTADPTALDESCTAHMGPYPFFVDLMGPPP